MAHVYINDGKSFVFNAQLSDQVILEYTDGTMDDLSTVVAVPDDDDDDGGGDSGGGEDPDPEPDPEPEPEPEPAADQNPVVTPAETKPVEYKCKGKLSVVEKIQRHNTTTADDICLTSWHNNWKRCIEFAWKNELPMVCVWTNGEGCGHCSIFASAVRNSTFKTFMKGYKLVWCFIHSADSDGKEGDSTKSFRFARGKQTARNKKEYYRSKDKDSVNYGYPFVCFWWRKGGKVIFDRIAVGDNLDGGNSGKKGAEKAVSYIKKKFKSIFATYGYDPSTGAYKTTGGST